METKLLTPSLPFLLTAVFLGSAPAQELDRKLANGACETSVYQPAEVSRKAVIVSRPEPSFTEAARQHNVQGRVMLSAVLCSTGRVTDVQILESLPHGLTEAAVEATRQTKFTPAEKDGRTVSQQITLIYDFNIGGDSGCSGSKEQHVGRLVESVEIIGNRRTRDEDILYYIGTRPGDPYDEAQLQRDLAALLNLQLFSKKGTCVSIEEGARGGVDVVFMIDELPIIRDLQFSGLDGVSESDVLKAFRQNRVGVWKESVCDPDKVEHARRVILELFAARGWPKTTVEVQTESLSAVSVTLIFIINQQK